MKKTKWYIDKIKCSIFMLFVSSISYSMWITLLLFREIALRHGENTLWVSIFLVITYIVCVATLIIGLHALDDVKTKIISKGKS